MTGWLRIGSVLVLIYLLTGCAHYCPELHNPVRHVVLLWYNDAVMEQEKQQVETETLKLRSIPQVVSIITGRAVPSERPIVDDSFDLAILMTFRSVEDLNRYRVDPQHEQFVERYIQGKVMKLLVYDF